MAGAMSRNKGAAAEREVVHLLKDAGWRDARRTSDGRGQQSRGDVTNGPAGVHIEVKRQERGNVPVWLRQAQADAGEFEVPIVVHRPSRMEWMCTLPLSDLLPLLALKERG